MTDHHPDRASLPPETPRAVDERLLDLAHDLLPPTEKQELLRELGEDPELEEQFRQLVALQVKLRATRPLMGPAQKTGPYRARRWRVGAGMAAAALLLLLVWPWLERSEIPLQLQPLPAYTQDVRFRAAVELSSSAELTAGLQSYADGDYAAAIDDLARADVAGQLETVRRLYLGSALAITGQHARAAAELETESSSTLPDPWGSESRWTLYVALRHCGRSASADSLLEVLADEPGDVGDRARKRLSER